MRPDGVLYGPLTKRLQLNARKSDSVQKDGENFFAEGLFTPVGNNTVVFDQKVRAFDDVDHFQSSFNQQGLLLLYECGVLRSYISYLTVPVVSIYFSL